jgi:large subunit ribosomal protein L6
MSRIGKNPVSIKEGVQVTLQDGVLTAKGKAGENSVLINSRIEIEIKDNLIYVKPKRNDKFSRSLWGTTKSLIDNAISGASEDYVKELVLKGVGYKGQVRGDTLVLSLGYSHDIDYKLPQGVKAEMASPTELKLSSCDKQKLGKVAMEIKKFRPPEPYQGKGIKFKGEYILRKEGKKK